MTLAADKLASSGLTLETAEAFGISVLAPEQTAALDARFPVPALRFGYHAVDASPLHWPSQGGQPFWRVRLLDTPRGSFVSQSEKPIRYLQAPGTPPFAYFPLGMEWVAAAETVDVPVLLTEGELKAACACANGFLTIGLGGVYNWRSMGRGISFLPELAAFRWLGRHVYVCFDSDYNQNQMVCAAIRELAEELERRGAIAHLVALPALLPDGKTGLDDYLVHDDGGPERLRALLHEAPALGLSTPLFNLNKRYAYVRQSNIVVDLESLTKVSPDTFKGSLEASVRAHEASLRPDGTLAYKSVPAAKRWIEWPLRHEVQAMTYRPGADREPADGTLNLWRGWGLEPKEDPELAQLFFDLVDHLFTGAEDASKAWFLDWLAYPLQHPGTKLFSAAVLHGTRHGTGKSLVGYTVGKIYGVNYTQIRSRDLQGGFNEWAEGKQFVVGDDVTGSDRRADADMLKTLITQLEIRINAKFMPTYVVPDCVNYFFTSNHPDVFFLEDDDRRYFVHEVQVGPMGRKFYDAYDGPFKEGRLSAAVFAALLKRDLSGFNPNARAFQTSARDRMVALGLSDIGTWVRGLLENPDGVLGLGAKGRELWTSGELLTLYDPSTRGKVTATGLARELKRAGAPLVYEGRPVEGGRYFAVKDPDHWLKASHATILEHLRQTGAKEKF